MNTPKFATQARVKKSRGRTLHKMLFEHGDHLTRDEFHRRYEAMPWLEKAELIEGVVYLPSPSRPPGAERVSNGAEMPPYLENGDHLTAEEFRRRYAAVPWLKKAELVKGQVYMASPVRVIHGRHHAHIMGWLFAYCAATRGVDICDNATIRIDDYNEFQPDAILRLEPEQGGRSRVDEDDYLEGTPELVVEVAASSKSYDMNEKRDIYFAHQVPEYIVWRVDDGALDWFRLSRGKYATLKPDTHGIIDSHIFPGLRLAVTALLKGDLAKVLRELQKGLDSEAHANFVQQLQS